MKRCAKMMVGVWVLICAVLIVNGCSAAKGKSFSKAGLTITLTDEFYEKQHDGYTAYYESPEAFVFILKEEFFLYERVGLSTEISLQEFAKLVIAGNNLECTVQESDGLTYFVCEKTENGRALTYFVAIFRGVDAYWSVWFSCETSDYSSLKADFINWAKSVTA